MRLLRISSISALVGMLAFASAAIADEFPEIYNSEKSTSSPMAPEEVVRTAKLPPGFQLAVFAAEPNVQNPIAITTDERGRVWVAENYTWSGASFGNYDTKLRDRVVILEDSDGDGRHDKRTVFWDQGSKLTSVEVGFGGVWVLNLPHLLFIPDRNRDDIPDGPPEVVLDGFDADVVGHTPANGLKWGPDGWLYGRHGIQATSSLGPPNASASQRVQINTGVWRYHPTRKVVEAVLHGMTNSWGYDFDAHGEMFVINTVIGHLWHLIPASHVERMYGIDLNPHVYQLIQQAADHVHWDTGEKWSDVRAAVTDKTSAAGGGHAHIGLMIYQGDNWPDEYRNRIYTLNLHGRRINTDLLQRDGATFTATHGQDFCFIADPWYRGMDLITGPDGGVYISDWSDTGECHDHDGVHRTSGRIYKLTYKTPRAVQDVDLATFDDDALYECLTRKNRWWGRQALRVWQERVAEGRNLSDVRRRFDLANVKLPADQAVYHLFALNAAGGLNEEKLLKLFDDPREEIRCWAVRLLFDNYSLVADQPSQAVLDACAKLSKSESSGLVQVYLASALQRLAYDSRWEIASNLASHSEFAHDRVLPLMVWYGIEPAVPRNPARAIELLKFSKIELVRRFIARRLTLDIEQQPAVVDDLVAIASGGNQEVAHDIICGMADALRGWRKAPRPSGWPALAHSARNIESDDAKNALLELNVVFGDGRTLDDLRAVIVDGNAKPESRQQALRALLAARPAGYAPTLHNLLADRAMLTDALRGLALYDDASTPAQILNRRGLYGPEARAEMINTLCSRPAYAGSLLAAVRDKQIDAAEISAFHARQIRAFDNDALTSQLTELWGEVHPSAAAKRALIDDWKSQLGNGALSHADLSAGRQLFAKNCSNCHVLYGAGRKVGPDLTGSNRKNLDYLLENILDPSASVSADFRAINVVLADGRVLSGVIVEQNDRTISLQTAQDVVVLDRRDIEETKLTSTSVMPDGLLQNLKPNEVRDLFAYLMSTDQVPLPIEQSR